MLEVEKYLASRRVAQKDNLLAANGAQILDQRGDIGDVVGQTRRAIADKRASQANLKD